MSYDSNSDLPGGEEALPRRRRVSSGSVQPAIDEAQGLWLSRSPGAVENADTPGL